MDEQPDSRPVPRVTESRFIVGDDWVSITRLEELILWVLAARAPLKTPVKDVVYFCYGDRDDGGPLYADQTIQVYVLRLKRKLWRLGWTITMSLREGYYIHEIGHEDPMSIPRKSPVRRWPGA